MTTDATQSPAIDTLWDYNDPVATEAKFRELLPAAESSSDNGYLAQLLTQIARTQGLQQRFEEAHATLDRAETLLVNDDPLSRVRYLLERGRAFNSSNHKEVAKPLFVEAYEIGRKSGLDFYAVDAAHMMEIVETGDEALKWNEDATALAEQSSDPRARNWLGALYNNGGWTLHSRGEFDRALSLFEKCLVCHQERNTGKGERIARWTIARTLRSLGRIDDALSSQQQLLDDMVSAGADPDGYVHEEIGECLLALGRDDDAAPHFRKAHELLADDIWLKRDESERLERMRVLGGGV